MTCASGHALFKGQCVGICSPGYAWDENGDCKPLTLEQKQLLQISKTLSEQETSQVRLSTVGFIGLGLLVASGYMIWRQS